MISEPHFWSAVTDKLPEDHPFAHANLYCVRCNEFVHAGNNENMDVWLEANTGPYCLPCWLLAYEEFLFDQRRVESDLGLGVP